MNEWPPVEEHERLCHVEKAKAPTFADLLARDTAG